MKEFRAWKNTDNPISIAISKRLSQIRNITIKLQSEPPTVGCLNSNVVQKKHKELIHKPENQTVFPLEFFLLIPFLLLCRLPIRGCSHIYKSNNLVKQTMLPILQFSVCIPQFTRFGNRKTIHKTFYNNLPNAVSKCHCSNDSIG